MWDEMIVSLLITYLSASLLKGSNHLKHRCPLSSTQVVHFTSCNASSLINHYITQVIIQLSQIIVSCPATVGTRT
jgi:hypothetical protein